MERGVSMGAMSLHFSKLSTPISTLLHAVLLHAQQQLLMLVSPSEHVHVAQFAHPEMCTHMRETSTTHAWQFFELVAYQTVSAFASTSLRLLGGHGLDSECKGLFGHVVEGVVDSSAQKHYLISEKSGKHVVIGRMGVVVKKM